MVREINSKELESKLAANEALYLLDIRSEAEVVGGMLPNSTHLPMHLIPQRINEFSEDQDIVLYCRSGARSYHACMYLMQQGFKNVINLQGGIIDWARNGYSIVAYG
ncbi:MAG: rhodanese-like domain-containing protein [Sedimenticola sp.]|uniref:Sulfurtransferase n=1 Tax=Sedimenticola thiotaurini TaxID=1543721 RepID=A0A558D119_9GAMM|nr:rhodanese-like domain-containing protein [Sedimenticola sp.]TVT54709.1 MAG: sulfurtransferase [Sedimenticola thiotaurini]MCW8921373.1 rhodanese-like domain-containing protein [Sedimenticola sp.]MCW8946871.1 rhodanese-like domain-containing protein [Sedimenticola sp.]MCW8948924.1 rhodanese-like domain-containing protein [Sedimenticola sp.]